MLPCLALALTGCVQGTIRVVVLPDGAGSIAVDLGYDTVKWPRFFGDPYAGFMSQAHLRSFTDPGMVAWSKPQVVENDGTRRWRGEVFFDRIDAVRFLGRHEGKMIEALGFDARLDRGEVRLRPGFVVYLDDPLPLPAPQTVGMTAVTLSPQLLSVIRQRIRPVIEGFDVILEIELPGEIERADGLDGHGDRIATLHVDADRLAAAFARRAGLLVDERALRASHPMWSWSVPANWDDLAATAFRQRRAAALRWWSAG